MTAERPIDWDAIVRAQRHPHSPKIALAVIVAAALLLRFGQFGNAIAGLDEQFYLLMGDRMWHGELPYIDIWDRKPVGLFVLFAAIRLLPGDGVLAAQLVATVAAAATAWIVALLVRRWVGWVPATMAAIFYLAGLGELWAGTTQTPVFFDLPVAAAALLVLRSATMSNDPGRLRTGIAAMLLLGIAIQIKTNAVFEGCFFGLWLVAAVQRDGRDTRATIRAAAFFALAGALPTLIAIGSYTAIGQFDAWWQANVLSVVAKGRPNDAAAMGNFWETLILTAPALLLALTGLWARTRRFTSWGGDTAFLLGWTILAAADFAAIGGYFPHYAIPLLLACCPLVASAFAIRRWGTPLFALSLGWPLLHAVWLNPHVAAREGGFARTVVAAIPADVRTRCLFIYEGPVIYYHLTQACRVTRYAFSAHLSSRHEAAALGVDAATELRATMARRPGSVMTVAHSRWRDRNLAMERMLGVELAKHYHVSAVLPYRFNPQDGQLLLWRRDH